MAKSEKYMDSARMEKRVEARTPKNMAERMPEPATKSEVPAENGGQTRLFEGSESPHILVFRMDGQKCALKLSAVERVIQAVAVTPVPGVPDWVLGLINMQGDIIPVITIGEWLGIGGREIHPSDQFVVARAARGVVALLASDTSGVVAIAENQAVAAACVLPGLATCIEGVHKLDGDIILIYDLDTFLARQGDNVIENVMANLRQ